MAAAPAISCRPAASQTSARGREIFASVCARCHGKEGRGGLPAKAGSPAPRDFADPAFQRTRTDAQIRAAIVHGVDGGAMPSFASTLAAEDLEALVRQVRSFGSEEPRQR